MLLLLCLPHLQVCVCWFWVPHYMFYCLFINSIITLNQLVVPCFHAISLHWVQSLTNPFYYSIAL